MSTDIIRAAQQNMAGITVSEDSTMAPPYNASELHAVGAASASLKTLSKEQPYHLANTISTAGHSGAVLYIQSLDNKKIEYLTNKFYLQALDISRREKVQILETFGAPVASFFGETARVYNFSGVALDWDTRRPASKGEYFHATSLFHLYENYMRGTKLVESNSVAILQVLNHSIYGYPLQFSYRALSETDKAVQFSFSMFVKDHLVEVPGLIDSAMINKNIKMQDVKNPLAKQLGELRKFLAPVITTLKYRQDKTWLDIQKSADHAVIGTAVEQLTGGDVTESDVTAAGDAIAAARDKYLALSTDYINSLKQTLPDPPSTAQMSRFGIGDTGILASPDGWTDILTTSLNLAWEWMPHADRSGANKAASGSDAEITTASILSGDIAIGYETGDAQVEAVKAAGYEDTKLGHMAFNTLNQLNSVDNMLMKRLATFYETLAAGNSVTEEQLLTV